MADVIPPIGTAELARKLGKTQSTAYRRLRRIREKSGDRAVSQDGPGKPLRTSIRALKDADPHMVHLRELEREEIEAVVAERFRARTAALERTNRELADRVKVLELQLNELRKLSSILFRGMQKIAKPSAPDSNG